MKPILKPSAWLLIFALFSSFMLLVSLTVSAQEINTSTTAANKKTEEQKRAEKLEEQEIRKFVDDFFVAFNETKDLNKIPDKFFISDFRSRFGKNDQLFKLILDRESNIQFSDNELYEYNTLVANYVGLVTASYIGNFSGNLDDYDEVDFVKLLPSQVVKTMNKSKWLQTFLDGRLKEEKPKNEKEVRSLAADIKMVSDDLRTYLKNRPSNWRRKYNRNFLKWRKEANSGGSSEVCYKDDCEGFPEKTRLFAMHAFSLCLRITKINGELKIVNVYLALTDD